MPLEGASCSIKPRSVAADLLRDAAILVWDEAPTAPKAALKAADELLRDLMCQPDVPFGGKVVVLGGDCRQIPSILRPVDERAVKSFTLRGLAWWRSKHVGHYPLTRNPHYRILNYVQLRAFRPFPNFTLHFSKGNIGASHHH